MTATNHLDEAERLRLGAVNEAGVFERLRHQYPVIARATERDDITNKIDAWVKDHGTMRSVQIKWRETGGDLGIAMVRPWVDRETFDQQLTDGTVPWDRDMKATPDLYAYATPTVLVVAEGAEVARICHEAAVVLADEGFQGRMRTVENGVELRLVTDKGRGYSGGQRKVICYISPTLLVQRGASIVDVTL